LNSVLCCFRKAVKEVAKEVETAVEFLETAMGATELGAVAAFSHLPG
jgi:hypothetical protein